MIGMPAVVAFVRMQTRVVAAMVETKVVILIAGVMTASRRG